MAKRRKNAKIAAAKLPAGYTAVAVGGGFGAWHDFNKEAILQGKVVGVDSMQVDDDERPGKKKTRRILRVATGNGTTVSVGESYAIKELFDVKGLRGKQVHIQFLGQRPFRNKKGKLRKVNLFSVAVK